MSAATVRRPRTFRPPTRCPSAHHAAIAVARGQSASSAATMRSCAPNGIPALAPTVRDATRTSMRTAAGRATWRRTKGVPESSAANHGQIASSTKLTEATIVWATDPSEREGRGSAATPIVASPAAPSTQRPGRRSPGSMRAEPMWARPVRTSATVMIQRCGVSTAASALIDSRTESKPAGCCVAATVQPPTSATTAVVALSRAPRGRPRSRRTMSPP